MTLFLIFVLAVVLSIAAVLMDKQHYTRTHASLLIVTSLAAVGFWGLFIVVAIVQASMWLGGRW